jgi:hypothetical protein
LDGVLILMFVAAVCEAQMPERTTHPVMRGTHNAVTSMKPETSLAVEQILRPEGNAYNAVLPLYDARSEKQSSSTPKVLRPLWRP